VILAFLVGGGILFYQYWWSKQEAKPPEAGVPTVEQPEEEFIELPIKDLIKGKRYNVLGVEFEIIEPMLTHEYSLRKDVCIPGAHLLREYSFKYKNLNHKMEEFLEETCGTAGSEVVYKIELFKEKANRWESISRFSGGEGFVILGYGDDLIVVANSSAYHARLFSDICIFNYIKERGECETFSYQLGTQNSEVIVETLVGEPVILDVYPAQTLIIKRENLNVKIRSNFCYLLGAQFREPSLTFVEKHYTEGNMYLFGGCVNEYLLLKEGELIKNNSEFKREYFKRAQKYDEILKKEEWSLSKDARRMNDWFSPLLARTLNYIFAGDEETAWQKYEKDFMELSKKYPLKTDGVIIEIDSQKIKEEIQKSLRGGAED